MNEVYDTPMQAWLGSVCKVLLCPLGVWVLIAILGFPWLLGGSVILLIAGLVGMVVHFIAYMVVGILIYEVFWRECPVFWTWMVGLPLGSMLGGVSTSGLVILVEGTWNPPASDVLPIFVVGAVYGVFTAAAAIFTNGKGFKQ